MDHQANSMIMETDDDDSDVTEALTATDSDIESIYSGSSDIIESSDTELESVNSGSSLEVLSVTEVGIVETEQTNLEVQEYVDLVELPERPSAPSPHTPILVEDTDSDQDSRYDAETETEEETNQMGTVLSEDIEHISQSRVPAAGAEITLESVPAASIITMATVPVTSTEIVASTSTALNTSCQEFRSPKKWKVSTPKKDNVSGDSDDDASSCPICFDPWTNSGIHRLASLKCGHLFGQSCLEKWLKGHGSRCPQCNTKAKWKDIRIIYATKSLRSVDTTETERVMVDLEKERSARQKAELEAAQTRLRYQMAVLECNKMKEELERQRHQIEVASAQASRSQEPSRSGSTSQPSQSNGRYFLNKTLNIRQAGGCRVMTLSPHLATLVISQPSSSPIFPGAGVKKVSCLDFKTTQYVAVHLKEIRDLSFHPNRADGLLLSGSLDKTIKLTSLMGNTVVQTIPCPAPVWSCVWNADDQNYFYAGLSNGSCYLCDIRQPTQHVTDLNIGGSSKSPVVAMDYLPQNPSAQFRLGGLLVGQMQQSAFHEKRSDGQHKTHLLPIEGLLFSLSVEQQTRHILASHRPTVDGRPTVRHRLHELACENVSINPTVIDNICTCRNIQTFHGGSTQKRLLRNRLIRDPSGSGGLLVCASDEASLAVHIWDTSTAHLKQKLNSKEPVLDICSIHFNDQHLLVSLTERQIAVYQYR